MEAHIIMENDNELRVIAFLSEMIGDLEHSTNSDDLVDILENTARKINKIYEPTQKNTNSCTQQDTQKAQTRIKTDTESL